MTAPDGRARLLVRTNLCDFLRRLRLRSLRSQDAAFPLVDGAPVGILDAVLQISVDLRLRRPAHDRDRRPDLQFPPSRLALANAWLAILRTDAEVVMKVRVAQREG